MTRQRTEILRALQSTDAFLTAAELHSRLIASGVTTGLATVYRSLDMLVDSGQVDAVRDEQITRYR
ncbi:MAG: transcriptional repressor, partial [Acidimicrobiia bacterium]